MNQEIAVIDHAAQQVTPFTQARALGFGANVGAVAIEQERAVAEAQGQLILAKRFPRSVAGSTAEFLEACKSPDFAATAFYTVPNRGSGESIRFMEEAARCYGNFQFGHRELSRTEGKSEIEVYAWDMEKNNRSTRQITVMHVVDTKQGSKPIRDQADIDNKIANVASKQVRGRIAALLPKGLVAAGRAECKKTLAGGGDKPMSQKINDMVSAFSTAFGVTAAHLSTYIGRPLDDTTIDELADLRGIFNALKEGAKVSEYFGGQAEEEPSERAASLGAVGGRAAEPRKKADPKPAAEKTAEAPKDAKAADAPAEAVKAADALAPAAEEAKPTPAPAAEVKKAEPAPAAAEPAKPAEAPEPVAQPAAAQAAAPEESVF